MSDPSNGPSARQHISRPWPRIAGRAVVAVVGWKKSGKTTLVERLVAALTADGFTVATVKHSHHAFTIDHEATDSARHRRAGARQVAIVSNARWAMTTELAGAHEPSLEAILARMDPADIVVVEGYKSAAIPKIEVRRLEGRVGLPLAPSDPWVVAIATDHPLGEEAGGEEAGDLEAGGEDAGGEDAGGEDAGGEARRVPVFALDDIAAITRLVRAGVGKD